MHVNAHLDVDLVAIETTDTVTVMLELAAPEAPSVPGPDRPVHAAKRAIVGLVARLDDRDKFGLVTFTTPLRSSSRRALWATWAALGSPRS